MISKLCGTRVLGATLGRRSYGHGVWKARLKDEGTNGALSYMEYVANAASFEAYNRHEVDPCISAETSPEISSLIDFKAFAHDYPQKLFPILKQLRPEFQEFFVEYYLLEKSQSFIGKTHGCIQTRIWQNLRLIEQAIGSMILLGPDPDASVMQSILGTIRDSTPYGSLSVMIVLYAKTHSYAEVAKMAGAPISAIRKIFRPAIASLLAAKDVKAIAVGAYLRSLTHQASLKGAGLSKRCIARTRRVKTLRFSAPPSDSSPLVSFGAGALLRDMPWCMLEISSDHRMTQIAPGLKFQGKKIFDKLPAQIFAPINADGELTFGYIFARCASTSRIRALTRVRGISEMAATYNDEGVFKRAVTIPHADILKMMADHVIPKVPVVRAQDFVEILTGPAARYCGRVVCMNTITEVLTIEVSFPTGRRFIVKADASCVKLLKKAPEKRRAFWGVRTA